MRAFLLRSGTCTRVVRGHGPSVGRTYAKRVTKGVVLPQGLLDSLPPLPPLSPAKVVDTGLGETGSTGILDDAKGQPSEKALLQYSTVLQGALDNIQKYPDCVVLTRVGGFYELYFNHAEELHRELGLKRSFKDTKLGPVAMAGFPFFQLDRYLKVLVEDMGRHVAISEEFTREGGPQGKGPIDLNNKNLFERRVSRVITPGTLIDEKFMETAESNFLLAIGGSNQSAADADGKGGAGRRQRRRPTVGLAWMDLSTGEFVTQEVDQASLVSHVQRIRPKEIITSLDKVALSSDYVVTGVPTIAEPSDTWTALVRPTDESFSGPESLAGSMLLSYVALNLPESELATLPPTRRLDSAVMTLDSNALYSLEIRLSMRDQSAKGSLLHALRRTTTKSGTRLLTEWLTSPITSIPVLERRLDLVQLLIEDEGLKVEVARFLKNSGDAVRVLQRFGFGRGEVDDLLTITKAISSTADLLLVLAKHDRASSLTSRMEVLEPLRKKIVGSIDQDGLLRRNRENAESAAAMMEEVLGAMSPSGKSSPSSLSSPPPPERRRKAIEREMTYTMKRTASSTLKHLHASLDDLQRERESLQVRLRSESGLATLTLKTLPGLSHIVHVKGTDARFDLSTGGLSGARAVSSTRSTKSYHVTDWSYLGTRIESTKIQIGQEEARTFQQLRARVLQQSASLRRNARVLDELDVASSFATLALQHGWVRPTLTRENVTDIRAGRHAVVELALQSRPGAPTFTPNDTRFSCYPPNPHQTRVNHEAGNSRENREDRDDGDHRDDRDNREDREDRDDGRLARMYLVTGTNMGGKSTFLRQSATLQIMAQVGSFLPASSAVMGIKDAVFSRLGSSDDLFRGESTFMVEMREVADILARVTEHSLVLMDEVGRGTTAVDGCSLAFATLRALGRTGASVLFATHFHELTHLLDDETTDSNEPLSNGNGEEGEGQMRVGRLCTDVVVVVRDEPDDASATDRRGGGSTDGSSRGLGPTFWFSHKIRRGVCRDSHGLAVAAMAGIPDHVILEAKTMQQRLLATKKKSNWRNTSCG